MHFKDWGIQVKCIWYGSHIRSDCCCVETVLCVFPHSGEVWMTAISGVIVAMLEQCCVFFLIGKVYVRSDCCRVVFLHSGEVGMTAISGVIVALFKLCCVFPHSGFRWSVCEEWLLLCWNSAVYFSSFRLQVVSTKVGGVPEVLPPDLIYLAEPSVKGQCPEWQWGACELSSHFVPAVHDACCSFILK